MEKYVQYTLHQNCMSFIKNWIIVYIIELCLNENKFEMSMTEIKRESCSGVVACLIQCSLLVE